MNSKIAQGHALRHSRKNHRRRRGCPETTTLRNENRQKLIDQIHRLMEQAIDFVPHPAYERVDFESQLDQLRPASLDRREPSAPRKPGVAFVSGLVEAPLLTPDEERYLFLCLNFLKSRAERARRHLDLRNPDESLVSQIEADLEQAKIVRNQIVMGNVRLIIAIAKQLTVSIDQMSDLIGEGMSPLIRSVELYDISLGNRFSTYATWAVRNQMYRWLKRNQNQKEFSPLESSPSLENFSDRRPILDTPDHAPQLRMEAVNRLLQSLPERERTIVAARFGLEGQPTGQSLSDVSQQVGLSKERVRQILLQSLKKLRELISYDEFEAMS